MPAARSSVSLGVGELVDAFRDTHGQIDVQVSGLTVDWKGTPLGLELNGNLSVRVHLRDLTAQEKKAHQENNLSKLRH